MNLPTALKPAVLTARALLGEITAPVIRKISVESLGSPLAWIFRMNVPANVQGNDSPAPVGGSNIKIILHFLDITKSIEGDVAECGVYQGGSILTMGLFLQQKGISKSIYGFDSFEGFSAAIEVDHALGGQAAWGKTKGGYGDTSFADLQRRINTLGLTKTICLRPGFFEQTFEKEPTRKYSFVHLDCDLYGSYKTCLEYFYPRMSPGSVILIDEYDDPPWPGCNKAVDEFLEDKAEKLTKIERDHQIKYYITFAAR